MCLKHCKSLQFISKKKTKNRPSNEVHRADAFTVQSHSCIQIFIKCATTKGCTKLTKPSNDNVSN